MKNLFLLFIFVTSIVCAQTNNKTCNSSKEESLGDMSSVTKCSIGGAEKGNKKPNQISVRVSANKARFRTKKKDQIINGVVVSSSEASKLKIISLKNNLSKEQVKKAQRFSKVDEIPTFNKCKNKKGDDRLKCFNNEMISHINTYFQYPSDAVRDDIQGDVWVRFVIDENGNVTNIRTINVGSDKAAILDNEAMRVVARLPKFVPGKSKGKSVAVKYGFPIVFSLEKK